MNNLYQVSKLEKNDYYRGFLNLLEQLTTVEADKISYENFCDQFDKMNSTVYVIRDISSNRIVASGTLLIERKFIHNLSCVGHIEDIVVNKEYRGLGLGKSIVNHLKDVAKKEGCYKVILNCSKNNATFYKKCDFKEKEIEMVVYFDE